MKINLNNTYATIIFSIVYALLLILSFTTTVLHIYLPQWGYYLSSFSIVACYSWIILFVINLLKATNEKKLIANAFAIYLVYTLLQYISGFVISMKHPDQQFLMVYSSSSAIIGVLIVIYLTIVTFMVKHKDIKFPLLFLVLCRLIIMLFYNVVPLTLRFLAENFSVFTKMNYMEYFNLIYILIPIGGIYLGVIILNLLTSEQGLSTTPNKSDFDANWPPYNKPNL
jgi:hypothetical protein